MPSEKGNSLNSTWSTYQKRYIKKLAKGMTPGQRESLLNRLEGIEGGELLQHAVTVLRGGH